MSTTILVSPLGRQEESTGEVIQLDVFVKQEEFFGIYDLLEVHKSTSGPSGPYTELTSDSEKTARIPKGAADAPAVPVAGPSSVLVGTELELLVGEEDEITVTFTGVDPLTYGDAAAQVTAQGQTKVRAYVLADGTFVVESTAVGSGALLRVVESDAAPNLRLPTEEPDSFAQGRTVRLSLVEGTQRYLFTDLFGSESAHYKTRFRNQSTGAVSEFSQPFSVGVRAGVDRSNLACGQATLVQASGRPLVRHEVRLHTEFNGTLVDGAVLAGSDIIKRTDLNGRVEFTLVKGQKVSVAVPGTRLVRTITVPDKDVFNLFDPDIADEDVFTVSVPDLVIAERRSL